MEVSIKEPPPLTISRFAGIPHDPGPAESGGGNLRRNYAGRPALRRSSGGITWRQGGIPLELMQFKSYTWPYNPVKIRNHPGPGPAPVRPGALAPSSATGARPGPKSRGGGVFRGKLQAQFESLRKVFLTEGSGKLIVPSFTPVYAYFESLKVLGKAPSHPALRLLLCGGHGAEDLRQEQPFHGRGALMRAALALHGGGQAHPPPADLRLLSGRGPFCPCRRLGPHRLRPDL